MLRVFYMLIKDYGTFGAVLVSIGINGFLFWKLFTNHLRHMSVQIAKVDEKVDKINGEISPIKERVSKLEGMLE